MGPLLASTVSMVRQWLDTYGFLLKILAGVYCASAVSGYLLIWLIAELARLL